MNTKLIKSVSLLAMIPFFLLLSNIMIAQTCTHSSLYGWATQNGGTTGGSGGKSVEVTTMTQLNSEAQKTEKLVIYVKGTLAGSASIKSNKTIFGLPGSKIQGKLSISGSKNVIVRNLIIRGNPCSTYDECKAGSDGVNLSGGSANVWLDHLDIADGQDGNCDITQASDFVTVSWCKFSYTYDKQHRFSNLNGSADDAFGDSTHLNITFHHNWWADRIVERQPRVRFGMIHVANNLYTSTTSNYIVGVGIQARVLVEGNLMKTSATPVQYFPGGDPAKVLTRNNEGPAAANIENGIAFVPPYQMPVDSTSLSLETNILQCAGATLADPRITVGVKEDIFAGKVVVFPQPFHNEVKIEVPPDFNYRLSDMLGRLIIEGRGNNVFETSSIPVGMYLLMISKNGVVKTIKIQKAY